MILKISVCFPYEFTLLSNGCRVCVDIPQFVSPTNLHCSQTSLFAIDMLLEFVSPPNLHCSQTAFLDLMLCNSLFPLRIYTALKLGVSSCYCYFCLFPLRIYTALKHEWIRTERQICLFPLRIYTALKLPPLVCPCH